MIITRKLGVLLVILLASGVARADETVASTGSSGLAAGGAQAMPRGPGGPEVARLLLQASLEQIATTSSLAAGATNIREALATAEKAEREARAALDEALVPQLRNGAIDVPSLASLVTAAEQARQAARVALVQAVDDARSLLTDAQRATVAAAVKAQLAPGPGSGGGQGAGGPPGGSGGPGGPPPGDGSGPGSPPPDATGASTGSAGAAGQTGSDASSARLAGDPLLAGLELTDVQKQALVSLGYLSADGSNGGSIPTGAPPPGGPPPSGTSATTAASTAATAASTGQAAGGPKVPGSELLEAFVSSATELPLPSAPTSGTSPTAERVRKLAILAEVLDTEQRTTLADRLTAETSGALR